MKLNRLYRRAGAALVVSCWACAASVQAADFNVSVVNTTGLKWAVELATAPGSTQNNPGLHLIRGRSYTFALSNGGHPFWIKTASSTGSANAYGDGVSANGVTNTTVTFAVPDTAPDTLFYNCGLHISMSGAIDISIFRDGLGD